MNPSSREIVAPVSVGELIDKITILRIKAARFTDAAKLRNVHRELLLLERTMNECVTLTADVQQMTLDLQRVNEQLWDVEDALRECESAKDFGPHFVELARSVYRHNDRRCAIKRDLNVALCSSLVEEKSYKT